MKKKVMLIEDDMSTIDVYKTGLEIAGFEVNPVITGEEAMKRLEEINSNSAGKPDIVLLDILLPDMNGVDILKKIRQSKNTKDLKVLILTNYSNKELEQRGMFLKAERYILKTECKPSDLAKLLKEELKT